MKKILAVVTCHMSHVTCHDCDHSQSGRSLIEVIGVMAIGAMMLVGTFQVYRVITARMHRMEASEDLRDIARMGRMMFAGRGDYTNISVPYLIKSGAIKTERPPRIAKDYTVQSETGGEEFSINLFDVSYSDCAWLALQNFDFVARISVNDSFEDPAEQCVSGGNKVSMFVR